MTTVVLNVTDNFLDVTYFGHKISCLIILSVSEERRQLLPIRKERTNAIETFRNFVKCAAGVWEKCKDHTKLYLGKVPLARRGYGWKLHIETYLKRNVLRE